MNLNELAKLVGADYSGEPVSFQKISIDTRTLNPGDIYFAIKGYSLDGHDYIQAAKEVGACAVVASRSVDVALPCLQVEDTTIALGLYAKHLRQQFKGKVFAITGSVGKTTTRNMLASICLAASSEAEVLCTQKNFNNQWGLPLTLDGLNSSHQYAVLELGMDALGEIAYLTDIASPNIAGITCACESHLERLGSLDNIAKAKGEIFQGLSSSGIAVLNADDAYFEYWLSLLNDQSYVSFGIHSNADIRGRVIGLQQYEITTAEGVFQVALQLLGEHNLMNVLAATAFAMAANIPLSKIKMGLESVQPEPRRMEQHTLSNGALIIDDTYNAAPDAMRSAIKTLGSYSGHTIFVMGDMAELGEQEVAIHEEMGVLLTEAGVDALLTFGPLSKNAIGAFSGHGHSFSSHEALLAYLRSLVTAETTIMVKGAARMKMEKIVQNLLKS